jgi:uncharacterized membrane protein
VGYLGVLDVPLPFVAVLAYFLMIVFAAMIDKNRFIVTLRQKVICLIIFLFGIGAIMTFDYLTWNLIGAQIIIGVQGRYFIPLAPLFFLLLYNHNHTKFSNKDILEMNTWYKLLIIGSIVAMLSLMIFILVTFYYSY